MKRHQKRDVHHGDIKRLCQQMHAYSDSSVRMIYEYYKDDLMNILGNIDTHALLSQLSEKNVLNAENYLSFANKCESDDLPAKLYQDILKLGREAVIGFWEFLCALQKVHPNPNLLAVLDEINHTGKHLVEQILLDEHGHSLDPDLEAIRREHKQHLLKKTQNLVEHSPPGTTLKPQEFFINERYVSLIVVSTDEFRQRPQNELIQTGIKHEKCLKETKTRLEHIFPNKLFRWSHQSQSVPHALMVSGVPGIGKTTLMQKFVYDWVTGKHYQRFNFVFFFRFRDFNRLGEVSLEDMILHQYPYLESQIGNIFEDPEGLLFIFDGLDESVHQMYFRSSKLSNHKVKECFGEIVASLVRQSLLKGCSILITSRPTRLASIDTGVFQRITEIMGFFHRDRLIYFKNYFGNKELSEKAFQYVQENDTLYTFCYIPSYCWIICTVLSMCFRAQLTITDQMMTSLPKTVTQLFVTFVANILANHHQNKDGVHTAQELLTSIGWMAEYGVMNHIIVFDRHHLDSFCVRNDNYLSSCFILESGRPPEVDYIFLHLTLQEFFAALVHFIDYFPDKLQKSLNEAESSKDGRAEIFLQFLCGLSDSSTRSMLKSHVGELSTQAARDVVTWIQGKIAKPQEGKRALLNMCYCLKESRNKPLVLQCIGSRKTFELYNVPLSPIDCSVLSFILESCEKIEKLSLKKCRIPAEGVRKLLPALRSIKILSLINDELTDSSCTHLASAIRNNQALEKLILSHNKLEGPHFKELMADLPTSQIDELNLTHNNLHYSCTDLASGIRNNQTVKRLDLSYNKLEGPDFNELMVALPTSQITDLRLTHNNFHHSCTDLACAIRNNQTLKILDLSHNKLEAPDFRELMAALPTSRIEDLRLTHNNLHRSCTDLASGIRNNQTLKKLDLSHNKLEAPDFRELMVALPTSQIEDLRLSFNNLHRSCADLASGIRNNQTLKKLDLSHNKLEAPDFSVLMAALPTSRIKELDLSHNKLTEASCTDLASGIRNNQTLRKLSLANNNLEGPHFSGLVTALRTSRIKTLDITTKDISEEAIIELRNIRPGLTINTSR
ncbi:NACHT, LRR and PYD domains-containing protein 12-like [Aquarana catesbeiana]